MRKGPYKRKPLLAAQPIVREILNMLDSTGWTNEEIEIASGVSSAYISQIRSGRRQDPSTSCLEALVGVFGRKLSLYPPVKSFVRPVVPRPVVPTRKRSKVAFAGDDTKEKDPS